MVRKTKRVSKIKAKTKAITVPELRRAFEHIHTFLHKGATNQAFRKEWKKVFGTELSEKAAADYLAFVQADKKQRGGAQMSPAPLGYDMINAGGRAPSVPAYVAGGMALPADSVYATCGQDKFLPPVVSMGNNQAGGKRKTRKRKQGGGALPSLTSAFSEFMQRPFIMGSPPGMGNDAMMMTKGHNTFSSPRPEINNPFVPQTPGIYTASISPTSKIF